MAEPFALTAPEHSERWIGDAEFSECERYRLWLTRRKPGTSGAPRLGFGMLNPSRAGANPDGDPRNDDATIGKCIGFARRWGYDALFVWNLYELIATDPKDLWRAPPGEQLYDCEITANPRILDASRAASLVVVAWGNSGGRRARERARDIVNLLRARGVELHCLGRTADGSPRHPSRIGYDTALEPYWGQHG